MKNTILRVLPLLLLISFPALANQDNFKQLIQKEIVTGMTIANNSNNPIEYGEQGGTDSYQGQLNPKYWDKMGNYHFRLKKGVSATEAINSIFPTRRDQFKVLLECHSMMTSIIYRALLQGFGPSKFDELFGKEGSTNQKIVIKYGDLKASGLSPFFLKSNIPKKSVELGDWVYFQNHGDYLAKHPDGPWQGENAIYVGSKQNTQYYSGFGAAELSEEGMIKELQAAYNESQSANDVKILKDEWNVLQKWLVANSTYRKGNYFQLKSSLFSKISSNEDPEDFIDELFEPVAKTLGYESISYFSTEFDYGVEEYEEGQYLFWAQKIKSYQDTIPLSEIPGLVRIDRLDFGKLYKLK